MNWNELQSVESIDQLLAESQQQPVMIFKHSTRCSISAASLDRLERRWNENEVPALKTYFLDLIRYREVSNAIATKLGITHQSPQVIMLKGGKPVHEASHFGIDYQEIVEVANSNKQIA